MILISACLCGVNCKYNGGNNVHQCFEKLMKNQELLPVCPEQLGGLPTPRIACEISGGSGLDVFERQARVINKNSEDMSEHFIRGARETLRIALDCGIDCAILQSRSPSCGVGKIYDGRFTSRLIDGDGVTAALLRSNGIAVISEEDFLRELRLESVEIESH